MALGSVAKTELRPIVWCRNCGDQVETDPAQLTERYGDDIPVLDWRERLVCSKARRRFLSNSFSWSSIA